MYVLVELHSRTKSAAARSAPTSNSTVRLTLYVRTFDDDRSTYVRTIEWCHNKISGDNSFYQIVGAGAIR